ncbi:MAG: hypothetical protein ACPLX7_07555 [Candidatus Kapaibacteriota bacterium]|jgi:hypothetical protein
MKPLIYTLFFLVVGFGKMFTQGFDWEISPRLPFAIPKFYAGISSNASKNYLNGSLTLYENYFSCAKFNIGSGKSNSFGFKAEYWYKPEIAFNASILYQLNKANFVADGDSFPVQIKGIPKIVKVENELSMNYNCVVVDFGAKYRLASTNFYAAFNLELGVKLSSQYDLYEQVKSPPEYHFIDNTQRRKLVDGKLSDLTLLFIIPKISIGYDATIFPGIYASPNVAVQLPLFNLSREGNLRLFSILLSISFMRGIW